MSHLLPLQGRHIRRDAGTGQGGHAAQLILHHAADRLDRHVLISRCHHHIHGIGEADLGSACCHKGQGIDTFRRADDVDLEALLGELSLICRFI